MTHPFIQSLTRPPVLRGLLAAAALAVAGVAVVGAFAGGNAPEARRSGPGMAITVVTPVEPAIDPGAAMEVGQLSDGFDRAALDRTGAIADDAYLPPGAYVGSVEAPDSVPQMPMPTPVAGHLTPMQAYRAVVGPERIADALDDGSRAFGFDRPRPDFAAERAARWAARDAKAGPPEGQAPTQSGPGPVPYTEIVKYSPE